MKITYKGDYALKALLDLALNYGRVVPIQELAKRSDIPIKFLEQILLNLKRGGFIDSKRGKEGGYFLGKHPSEITVGEVVEYVDGPIEPIACVNCEYTECRDVHTCVFKNIWKMVAVETHRIVDSVTFEKLVNQVKEQEQVFVYSI